MVFSANATNLVGGDNNGFMDIFVKDLETGEITRVSEGIGGWDANGPSNLASISADGRYVVFQSDARNLIDEDAAPSSSTNQSFTAAGLFLKDLETGEVKQVNTTADGSIATYTFTQNAQISGDGTKVIFQSSGLLVDLPGLNVDKSGGHGSQVYMKYLVTGELALLSIATDVFQAFAGASYPTLSYDGSVFAFGSLEDEFVENDSNGAISDIFVSTGEVFSSEHCPADEALIGSASDDYLVGDGASNLIRGEAGNDQIFGKDDHDCLFGDAGNDEIEGGLGDDLIEGGAGDDVILGDTTLSNQTEGGADEIYGGDGADRLYGGFGADEIYGDADDDRIVGDWGDDSLYGGDGEDVLYGEEGNDFVYGDAQNDLLYGNDGNDRLFGGDGEDRLFGGNGYDVINADAGNDVLHGWTGNDTMYGGDGDDRLFGEANNDVLSGDKGNDFAYGGTGNDTFLEQGSLGLGNDHYIGGDGTDLLWMNGTTFGQVSINHYDWVHIQDIYAGDLDKIKSVEYIRFSDGTYDVEAQQFYAGTLDYNDII
ncbi:MAG: hypothetical protein F6K48_34415 [Okeania sp. SIO3H1]|nr:hypothetical protein [Okeania sp. SIO3H1]